jgi:ankyrin repeat protein
MSGLIQLALFAAREISPMTNFATACIDGDYSKILNLLSTGNCNALNTYVNGGDTPLILACKKDNLQIVKLLDNFNVDIKQKHKYDNYDAFICACKNVSYNCIKYFIKKKYNSISMSEALNCIFTKTKNISKVIKCIDLLIQNGADINFICSNGNTILTNACCEFILNESNSIEALKYLIKLNVNINKQTQYKYTALMNVCNISCTFLTGKTSNRILSVIKLLLNSGANINTKNYQHVTPLLFACKNMNEKCIKYLVNNNADIHASDRVEGSVLHYMCSFLTDTQYQYENDVGINKIDRVEMILYFLKKGANINKINYRYNYTPLMTACDSHMYNCIETLLNNNVDIDIKNSEGENAIIISFFSDTEKKRFKHTKMLIKYGADISCLKNPTIIRPFFRKYFDNVYNSAEAKMFLKEFINFCSAELNINFNDIIQKNSTVTPLRAMYKFFNA